MLRALWFALKIAVIAVAAVWVSRRPGTVEIDWLGYGVTAHVGFVFVCFVIFLFLLLFIYRLFLAVTGLPGVFRRRGAQERHSKGYRALIRGLSAVAAGDGRLALSYAGQARKYWPEDRGLSVLLEAQAARLKGEKDKAEQGFRTLMKDRDTAFLGLRGLIAAALEDGEGGKALTFARQALALHPRQKWLLQTTYDLELSTHDWSEAEKTLKAAVRAGALGAERAKDDRVAMLLYKAQAQREKNPGVDVRKEHRLLADAHRLDPASVPAAQRLAAFYIHEKKRRAAAKVLETTWKHSPHPELAAQWGEIAPENKPTDPAARLRWFEKLVALRPDSDESQLAAAKTAMEDGMWGETRQYLNMAEQISESARLCRLWARFAEKQGQTAEAAFWLERAADAPAGAVWHCTQTGRIYDRWSPIAQPHGALGTIKWGYPESAMRRGERSSIAADIPRLQTAQ